MKWLGRVCFWLAWPVLWVYLYKTERTRLIVHTDNELLVVKNWLGSGRWGLPGGGTHRHESVIDAAVRELREETGLAIKTSQVTVLERRPFTKHAFRFNLTMLEVRLPKTLIIKRQALEISDADWLTREEISATKLSFEVELALRLWRP